MKCVKISGLFMRFHVATKRERERERERESEKERGKMGRER